MSDNLLCVDCKHSFRTISRFFAFGSSPHAYLCKKAKVEKHTKPDPVVGSKVIEAHYETCPVYRIGESKEGNCGRDGYYWQPKHKAGLFKLITKES